MSQAAGTGSSGWLAAFREQGAAPGRTGWELDLIERPPDWSPVVNESHTARIVFDGALDNRDELRAQFAEAVADAATDADLVGHAYRRWGEDAIARLRGAFALLIADRERDLLLCARDPLGIRPLFYAEVDRTLLLSPSIDTLLGHAGVSSEINRAALVDRLQRRWPVGDETYFTRVRRVPPGHVMRVSGHDRRVYRYWSPLPADGPLEWIPDDEVQERFEALLKQALARCLMPGPAAIHLSGGLDSSTLAMVATDLGRERGWEPPCALSLVFETERDDEAALQRRLAAQLGLAHVQFPFEDAVAVRSGARRLVHHQRSAALRATASPPWIAPDPTLRAQVTERLEASFVRDEVGPRPLSSYIRDTRSRLDSADKWFREEETFLLGQRTGIPIREPFWDPDLIDCLVRVRPGARSAGGLTKALERRPLTKRFPDLGFDRQRKSWVGAALLSVLESQAAAARQATGGFPTLVDLGVIDREQVRVLLDDALAGGRREQLGWAWELLNLEAWTRAHA